MADLLENEVATLDTLLSAAVEKGDDLFVLCKGAGRILRMPLAKLQSDLRERRNKP